MPFGFLNGALMWGSLLISVPIIIHLLNRRRFRIIDWAAMEWLLLAIKQNKRRITIEQLILLALRCLIILLIVLAVSKIVFSGMSSAMTKLIGRKTDWVVMLDDSFTMGQNTGAGTCFDTGKTEILALLRKVLGSGTTDSFRVMLSEKNPQQLPAVPQVDRDFLDALKAKLDHLNPTDMKQTPFEQLERGIAALRTSANPNKALVLVTDCRRDDWRLGDEEKKSLRKSLDEARKIGITVYLIDVGPKDPKNYANLCVTRLEVKEKSIQSGAITGFSATVENFGPEPVAGVPVKFVITEPGRGEITLPTQTISKVAPGQSESVEEYYRFKTPGFAAVTAEIGVDSLPADNSRHLAVEVTEGIDVLVVDGEAEADKSLSETFALEHALRPENSTMSGISPRVFKAENVKPSHLEAARVIFLANVEKLPDEFYGEGGKDDELRKAVEEGRGLVIFLGDKVDPATFNKVFWNGGNGVSPCEIDVAVGDAAEAALSGGKFVTFSSDGLDHPLVANFSGPLAPLFVAPRFYRRFGVKLPPDLRAAGMAVIVRYSNPADPAERAPAIIERDIGKGKSILITSSADSEWNNWVKEMSYPIMMNRLVEYLYRPSPAMRNIVVGARYVRPVDIGRFDANVTIEPAKSGSPLNRAAQPDETQQNPVVAVDETAFAGIYTVRLKSRKNPDDPQSKGGLEVEYFSANLDPTRSNLVRGDAAVLKAELANLGVKYGRGADDIWQVTAEEQVSLWHIVLIILGCCLAVESFLGWKFGHHTK